MTIELYIGFVLASALLALAPGPAMSLIIANSASYGVRAGLKTVAGGGLGLGLLVAGAVFGMSSVMALMADWFDVIRWIGAGYLVWLGASRLYRALKAGSRADLAATETGRGRCFWQGLAVALSNPKVLLFLGAFFPQFINPNANLSSQLALMAVTFLAVMMIIDASYAVLAGSARRWFTSSHLRIADGLSGSLLICGGLWLAAARRA